MYTAICAARTRHGAARRVVDIPRINPCKQNCNCHRYRSLRLDRWGRLEIQIVQNWLFTLFMCRIAHIYLCIIIVKHPKSSQAVGQWLFRRVIIVFYFPSWLLIIFILFFIWGYVGYKNGMSLCCLIEPSQWRDFYFLSNNNV